MQLDLAAFDPRPADLIAFSAAWDEPSGWLIKLATRSTISHVAGVAYVDREQLERELRRRDWPREPDLIGRGLDRLLSSPPWPFRPRAWLFESTTLCARPCQVAGEWVSGVQCHLPRQRIGDYLAGGGSAWLYRPSRDFQVDQNQSRRLTEFLLRHLGERYDYAQAALSGTIVSRKICRWATKANLHSLFCSELWAAALEQIRLLNLTNPSMFSPARLIRALEDLGSYRLVGRFAAEAPS